MEEDRQQELKHKVLKLIADKQKLCLHSIKLNPDCGFGKLEQEGYIKVEVLTDSCYASITHKGEQFLQYK